MTIEVVTFRPEDTIGKAIAKFAEHHIRGAPVVNSKSKVIGIVTETDILEFLKRNSKKWRMIYPSIHMSGVQFVDTTDEELTSTFKEIANKQISDIMNDKVVTISPDVLVVDVLTIMGKECVNRLPVVENDKLVGIISKGDVIRNLYTANGTNSLKIEVPVKKRKGDVIV